MGAKRIDGNQNAIVAALRKCGASVQILSGVGKGCPDILIGDRGYNFIAELKDDKQPLSGQKLTLVEAKWHEQWRGQKVILHNVEEAINFLNHSRKQHRNGNQNP
ncbi:MAG: hypothetical protein H9535_19810 [Ignavibacteria bacterium]|nr:hypothetical protein [Ignavibacteria bacterium]